MYKKVHLMSPPPASISRRNEFMRKLSLMETMKDATIFVHKKHFYPGVSYLRGGGFSLKKEGVFRDHVNFIYDKTIDINMLFYCHYLLQ